MMITARKSCIGILALSILCSEAGSQMRAPPDIPTLIKALQEGDASDKMAAAERLGEAKAKDAFFPLIQALNDPDPYVRGWSAWALGKIGDQRAIGPLIAALGKRKRIAKKNIDVREVKCLPEIAGALEKLTSKKFGLDVEKWEQWWKEES